MLRGGILYFLQEISKRKHLLPRRLETALENLKKDRNIRIFHADKGGKVVVMNMIDYENKASDLLSDTNTYQEVTSNPLEKVNKNFRSTLRVITKNCEDPRFFTKLLPVNASLPYFYGLPKLHKPGIPLRPIISGIGSVTHPLAKYLAGLLSPFLGKFSHSHLLNSLDFKNRLQEFATNNSLYNLTMVSFDVTSLFTNVPLQDVLDFLVQKNREGLFQTDVPIDVFVKLIELCVNNNYFAFSNKFYKQTFGVAMGSPLSPVLANIYMEYFESVLLASAGMVPPLWLRYVDDVFCLWDGRDDFQFFLDSINSLAPSINFTIEWEEHNSLPFLDVTVHRNLSHFQFSIYRKPTHSGMFLHYFSYQPEHIKRGVLLSQLLRAYRLCDPQFLATELKYLNVTFSRLGYPDHLIQSAHAAARSRFYACVDGEGELAERAPVLVLPFVADDVFLRNFLKSYNVKLVNRQFNSLRSNLVQTNNTLSQSSNKPGTYVIPCSDCDCAYIGETGRSLNIRISEHKRYIRTGSLNSAIFIHVQNHNHSFNFDDAKIVYKSSNKHNRLIIESALIKQYKNVNVMPGACSVDSFTTNILLRTNSFIVQNMPGSVSVRDC